MIDVYSWATPNGHKIHIMLEECGYRLNRDWKAIPIDIGKGDQFNPEFLKISPNNKIPAIIDSNGPDGKPIHLWILLEMITFYSMIISAVICLIINQYVFKGFTFADALENSK